MSPDFVPPEYYWFASVIATGVLLILPLLLRKTNQSKVPWPKVPGALPIIGNPLGGNGVENLVTRLEEWATEHSQENGIYEFNLFGKRIVVLCTTDAIAQIANERPFKMRRINALTNSVNSVGAHGLFSAEGDTWKSDRRLVAPVLNKRNVKDYLPHIKRVTARLVEKWRVESENGAAFVINEDVASYTMDNIALLAYGEDFDSLRQAKNRQVGDLLTMFQAMQIRMVLPLGYWKIPIIGQYIDGCGWAIRRLLKSFDSLVQQHEAAADKSTNCNASTFLAKLVSLNKQDKNSMSHYRMIGNLLTVFAAGSDTTHVAICSSLWEIASDFTLQTELAKEAQAVANFDDASMDDILEALPRLRSLIAEVVRIRGPAPMLGVENVNEMKLHGVALPPQTSFFMLLRYASTLESSGVRLGPNGEPPADFCARRWLANSDTDKVSFLRPSASMGGCMAFSTGFGTGMRLCPGKDLAEIETLICLASLLCNFEISLEENHPEMKLVSRFTESPGIDIRIKLKSRTRAYS